MLSPRTAWPSHGWREILNLITAALSRTSLFPFRNYPWNHHFRTPPLILFQNGAPSRKMSYNCLLPGGKYSNVQPILNNTTWTKFAEARIICARYLLLAAWLRFSEEKKNYIACSRSSVLGDGTRWIFFAFNSFC